MRVVGEEEVGAGGIRRRGDPGSAPSQWVFRLLWDAISVAAGLHAGCSASG